MTEYRRAPAQIHHYTDPPKPQVKPDIEDLSHVETQKQRLRDVQTQRSEARVILDDDRGNRAKYLTFTRLDKEYEQLLNQLA